jgi:hypothetical protein
MPVQWSLRWDFTGMRAVDQPYPGSRRCLPHEHEHEHRFQETYIEISRCLCPARGHRCRIMVGNLGGSATLQSVSAQPGVGSNRLTAPTSTLGFQASLPHDPTNPTLHATTTGGPDNGTARIQSDKESASTSTVSDGSDSDFQGLRMKLRFKIEMKE